MRSRALRLVPLAAVLAGCPLTIDESRIGAVDDAGTPVEVPKDATAEADVPDTSIVEEAGVDSAVPDAGGPSCDTSKPWGNIRALAFNDNGFAFSGQTTADELSIYVHAGEVGSQDIYKATRASIDKPFGPLAVVPAPISVAGSDEAHFSVSTDELTAFFASNRTPSENRDIWRSKRAKTSDPWGAPDRLTGISTTASDTYVTLTRDGKQLYFSSVVAASNTFDIFVSAVDANGNPAAAVPVSELNTNADHEEAFVPTADGLTAYFARRAPGGGDSSIYVTKRATTLDKWGKAELVPELNSAAIERPSSISVDGCRLYFSSDRPGKTGGSNIYVAEKPKLSSTP